jgi:hypothetical protein
LSGYGPRWTEHALALHLRSESVVVNVDPLPSEVDETVLAALDTA